MSSTPDEPTSMNEPTLKLRVVHSDAPLGASIESSSPRHDTPPMDATALTLVNTTTPSPAKRINELKTSEQRLPAEMAALMGKAKSLRIAPTGMLRLAMMTGDATVTPTQIEKSIGSDKSIADKVIDLANSTYYNLPRKVYYMREALVFLGYMSIRNLAVAVNAQELFARDGSTLSPERSALWKHSLETALLARKIAEHMSLMDRTSVGGEEAFISGILHDIGKLAFDMAAHDEYVAAIDEALDIHADFSEVEMNHLPFTHCEIGQALLKQWNFPSVFCDVVFNHHEPANATVNSELVATVCIANELAHAFAENQNSTNLSLAAFDSLNPTACAILGVQRREIHAIVDACREELANAKPLYKLV